MFDATGGFVPLSPEDIRALLAAFDDSDWDHLSVTVDGTQLTVGRNHAPNGGSPATAVDRPTPADQAPPPAATTPEPAPTAPATPPGQRITAPSVGLFWRAPQPGAPAFVEVGDRVGADDTLCILEVMKLMNHIRAGFAGVVRAIHVTNGQMVEHGEVLFTIEPVD
jgi:acetyl-CoA carboxylase biotin carboxyl carrier protein